MLVCAEVYLYVDFYEGVEEYDGIYVGVRAEVLSYVNVYEGVELYGNCEVVFCVVCLGAYIQDQRNVSHSLIYTEP